MSLNHETRTIPAADGTKLHVDLWRPQEVRFVVAVSHGNAEHAGRYGALAADLGSQGALVFGPDHRGQGLSGGRRGHASAFEEYTADLRHVMLEVASSLEQAERPSSVPWFLFGHSMGGLIALTYLLDHENDVQLAGSIISAPLLGLTMKVNPLKVALGKVAGVLAPNLALPTGIPETAISRDPDVVERYANDERRSQVVTAGWFSAMNRAVARVEHEAKRIGLPMLWYAGTGDLICDPKATRAVFETMTKSAERDQTWREFDGYYHELHNEPVEFRAPIVEMLQTWLDKHL